MFPISGLGRILNMFKRELFVKSKISLKIAPPQETPEMFQLVLVTCYRIQDAE
jgi:hypothetical protein